jgi:5-formyltetrahydrofolate cyclo-ligase
MDSKADIRRRMRAIRADIPDPAIRSAALWEELSATDGYRHAATIMAFVSMPGEPDTAPLFERLERDGKTLVLPRIVGDVIEAALVGDHLVAGPLHIPSPTGAVISSTSIDLVIVPGVAFSAEGGRVGHGKAYYDRFLAGISAPTIGVCFREQVLDAVPMELHDRFLTSVLVA